MSTIKKLDKLEDNGVLSEADISRLGQLTKKGVLDNDDLHRITTVLETEYSGKWSPGPSHIQDNFNYHYNEHVVRGNEWGSYSDGVPKLTKEEYRQKAIRLANDKDAQIYFNPKKENVVIYDDVNNELVAVNAQGEIQTLFRPSSPNYIPKRINDGRLVEVN